SKEISDVLKEKKDWKPATTKTFIGRLVKKGMLSTEPKGNRYLYTATVSEDESLKSVTDELFYHICNKEVGKTIAELISEAILSHKDV
ncbi:BlaI/MecI/CopY family transcriptional regulator, partial [Micrococcus sp. SIMBA_144]